MSGDGWPRKGRYHLVLSVQLWDALVAEASRRRMRVSHVVQERLAASLGITEGGAMPAEVPASQPVEKGKRHHWRLSMDSVIWDRLAREAASREVSVTEIIRRRLRQAVLRNGPEMRWSGPGVPVRGEYGQDPQDDGRLESRSITVFEL